MLQQIDIKLCIVLLALGATVTVWAKDEDKTDDAKAPPELSVQINEAVVRGEPSFLSPVSVTLRFGDKVNLLDETEDWRKVRPVEQYVDGWMHVSALTEKKIVIEAGENDANVDASKQELVYAGRGYNQEVEDKFREEHEDLDQAYSKLDRLLADPRGKVTREQIMRFMREGELDGNGGGR